MANGAVRHHPHTGVEVEHEGQTLDANQAADAARSRAQGVAGEANVIAEYVYIRNKYLSTQTELVQGGC